MASVYKRNNTGPYIISWFDATGRRREKSSRTTDRRAAERIAAKLDADAALRRDGVVDATADRYAEADRAPLAEHLADWHKSMLAKGNTPQHSHKMMRAVLATLEGAKAAYIREIDAASVAEYLAERRTGGLSIRTSNYYLCGIKSFCK